MNNVKDILKEKLDGFFLVVKQTPEVRDLNNEIFMDIREIGSDYNR